MNVINLQKTIFNAQRRAYETLHSKNDRYNPGENKLDHFQIEDDFGLTLPEQIKMLLDYASKHWKKIKSMASIPDVYPFSEWTESLDDMVNYLHLLECLLIDSGQINTVEEEKESKRDG